MRAPPPGPASWGAAGSVLGGGSGGGGWLGSGQPSGGVMGGRSVLDAGSPWSGGAAAADELARLRLSSAAARPAERAPISSELSPSAAPFGPTTAFSAFAQPPVPLGRPAGALGGPPPAASAAMLRSLDAQLPFTDGAMFVCTKFTQEECLRRGLMGLPRRDLDLVSACTPGRTALFLFNFSTRQLHGLFVASSPGRLNWDADAWKRSLYQRIGGGGRGGPADDARRSSPFPSQVRFRVVREYTPLHEEQFSHLIRTSNRVTFLDAATVRELIRLFGARDARNAPANPTAFRPDVADAQPPHTHSAAAARGDAYSYAGGDSLFGAPPPPRSAFGDRPAFGESAAAAALSSRHAALARGDGGYRSYGDEEADADAHAAAAAAASVEMLFGDELLGGLGGPGEAPVGDEEDGLCVVCLEQPQDCVLQPCGHAAFCYTCVADLAACPLCRSSVAAVRSAG